MDERRQAEFRRIPLLAFKEASKDRNLTLDPGLAQLSRFRETGNSEPATPVLRQGPGHGHATVPIGIGLDDGQNSRARPDRPANRLVVANHGAKINPSPSAIRSHV